MNFISLWYRIMYFFSEGVTEFLYLSDQLVTVEI